MNIPPLTLPQTLELILVAMGAFAHTHLGLSRSRSSRTLWFNGTLYGWALSWSTWYALTFISLNLETLNYGRIAGVSMILDMVKGALINLQGALLLHGLVRWTGRTRPPHWVWYMPPLLVISLGYWPIIAHPGSTFLRNVDGLVLPFLWWDVSYCALGAWLLRNAEKELSPAAARIAAPLRTALCWMIPVLLASIVAKIILGHYAPGKYGWVLYFDLAHLLAPTSLLLAAYRTESVALEVTQSSMRRTLGFAGLFAIYLSIKSFWPGSSVDRIGTFLAAGVGVIATLGPLSIVAIRSVARMTNWRMNHEARLLLLLESRLRETSQSTEVLVEFASRCLGRILSCRARVLAPQEPVLWRILDHHQEELSRRNPPRLFSLRTATSRGEILAYEDLGARFLLPVFTYGHEGARSLHRVIALGVSHKATRFPSEIVNRLRSIQATLSQAVEARHFLQNRLESERREQESERLTLLGLMSASAAHEIKNPLSAIRNVASAALRDAPSGSVLQRDLEVVVGEVDRLDASVRRMLHFARDRGATANAAETVQVVCGLLQVEAKAKGLRILVDGDLNATDDSEGALALPLSENDLKAVLFNLVLNALHHAPKQSVIRVVLDYARRSILVENDGDIPEDFRPRLFQPLASRGGTGLGLYISKDKVDASGGRLVYEPSPGRTAFRMTWEEAS